MLGYFRNHLATLVMGVFAAVLSFLWPYFNGFAPVLDFVFLMAVPISWFLVAVLWLAQASTNYMHYPDSHHAANRPHIISEESGQSDEAKVLTARAELGKELDDLRKSVEIKDSEIEDLKKQISTLETQVQIESIRTDLAKLRNIASKS